MYYKIILLSALSIVILTAPGCKKNAANGTNTFSCKVDGKVFKPSDEGTNWSGTKPILVSNSSFNGFTLRGRKFGTSTSTPVNVQIRLPYLNSTGTYPLTTYGYGAYEEDYAGGPAYYTGDAYTGMVNISRCDTVNQIYTGTFSFKAVDTNTGKTVNVTDGKFDVKR